MLTRDQQHTDYSGDNSVTALQAWRRGKAFEKHLAWDRFHAGEAKGKFHAELAEDAEKKKREIYQI